MAKEQRGAKSKSELDKLKEELKAFKEGRDLAPDLGDPAIAAAQAGYRSVAEHQAALERVPFPNESTPPLVRGMYELYLDAGGKPTHQISGAGGYSPEEQRVHDERFAVRDATLLPGGWSGGSGGASPSEQVAIDRKARLENQIIASGAGDAGAQGRGADLEMATPPPLPEEAGSTPSNLEKVEPAAEATSGVPASIARPSGVPAAIARPASPAKVVTGRAGRRLGGAFLNLPEDLRPEILPGGFVVYPDNRENYEARLNQAVEDGKVSPAVAKKVMAGYDKWRRTPWGASVDYTRLVREQKHIQQESERDANLIESRRADQEAQLRQKLVEASQQLQADYEEERAIQIEELDNQLAKQQQAIEELQTTRVDPSRWWNSKSDAQKAVSAISLALGTLGSGLSGIYGRPSPNVAYDMIKNAINNDIRAQEADLGSRRAALSGRQNLMTTIFGKVKDAATASNMARMALLDQTKAKLDMYAASAVGDTARRNAQMLRELIDNDREIVAAEIRMNAGNAARAAAAARAKAKTVRRGPVLVSKDDKRMISQVFGGIVQGIDPDGLRALEKEVHDNNALATSIYDIKQMMASPGSILGTKLASRAARIHQAIQQGERKKQFGAAFTVTEKDMDDTGMLTENAASRMRTAWRNMFHGGSIPLEGIVEKRAAELRQRAAGLTVFPGTTPLSSYEIQSGGKAGQRETAAVWNPTGPEQRVVDAIVVNPDGTRSFRTKAVQHGVSTQAPSVHESLRNTKRRGPQTGQ